MPPPAEVERMITRFGDPAAITPKLAQQLTSGNARVLPPPPQPSTPPATAEIPPPSVAAKRPGGLVAEHAEVERFPRALMGPPALQPREPVGPPAMEAAPVVYGWIKDAVDEYGLNKDIEEALTKAAAAEETYLRDHPDKSVLLAAMLTQAPPRRQQGPVSLAPECLQCPPGAWLLRPASRPRVLRASGPRRARRRRPPAPSL
jgi:hypothetical protein